MSDELLSRQVPGGFTRARARGTRVKLDPTNPAEAQWLRLIRRMEKIMKEAPAKETLDHLDDYGRAPGSKAAYIRSRLQRFAEEFTEAVDA